MCTSDYIFYVFDNTTIETNNSILMAAQQNEA